MTPARAVQFVDPESVLAAFTSQGMPSFAIFCGKQLFVQWPSNDMEESIEKLAGYLRMLHQQGSAGIYTVAVYANIKEGDLIDDKTPYNGAMNFRFAEYGDGSFRTPGQRNLPYPERADDKIDKLLEAMNKRLDAIEQERIDREQEEADRMAGTMDAVGRILESPLVAALTPAIVGLISSLTAKKPAPVHPMQQVPPASQLGGIPATNVGNALSDEQKIATAIEKLKGDVPDLPDLLLKLSRMPEKKAIMFKVLIAQLRGMNV